MNDTLNKLAQILNNRKNADPNESYVAGLYSGGIDKILRKIGEEVTETIIAAKNGSNEELIYEMADLWFHTLILLSNQNIEPQEILDEIERRLDLREFKNV